MKFRTSDNKTHQFFQKKGHKVIIETIENIRVIKSESTHFETAVLFIHGTPGSGNAFYDYLTDSTLLSQATLITYDRPGYGYSSYGQAMTSIRDQVAAILPTIANYKKVYVVGHSYGGPIAAYLAIKATNVQGVVLIAPAIYPHREKFHGIAKLGATWPGQLLSSKAIQVASLEKITHQEALEEIEKEWSNLTCPITHIHSSDDKIVPFENTEYTQKMFTQTKVNFVKLHSGNHFLPWNHYDLVKENILKLMDEPQQ